MDAGSRMTHSLTFTGHARAMLRERGIDRGWVERVVQTPEWTKPDPADPTVTRAFGRIAEHGGRTLRVVHIDDGMGRRIITVFFDRTRGSGPPGGPS